MYAFVAYSLLNTGTLEAGGMWSYSVSAQNQHILGVNLCSLEPFTSLKVQRHLAIV